LEHFANILHREVTAALKPSVEALAAKCATSAEPQTQEDAEQVYVGINSLKSMWEGPFKGNYKRLIAALDTSGVTQQKGLRRRNVNVAEFTRWINIVKRTATSSGVDPSDSSTWTDEMWNSVAREFADHQNVLDEIRQERRQEDRRDTE
jgi:hypothetical protein